MQVALHRFEIVLLFLVGLCCAGSLNAQDAPGAGPVTDGEKLAIVKTLLGAFVLSKDSSAIPDGVLTLSNSELPNPVAESLAKEKFKFKLKLIDDPGSKYKWDFTFLEFYDWKRSGKAVMVTYILRFEGGSDTGCTESYLRSRGRWTRRTSECFATADDRR